MYKIFRIKIGDDVMAPMEVNLTKRVCEVVHQLVYYYISQEGAEYDYKLVHVKSGTVLCDDHELRTLPLVEGDILELRKAHDIIKT